MEIRETHYPRLVVITPVHNNYATGSCYECIAATSNTIAKQKPITSSKTGSRDQFWRGAIFQYSTYRDTPISGRGMAGIVQPVCSRRWNIRSEHPPADIPNRADAPSRMAPVFVLCAYHETTQAKNTVMPTTGATIAPIFRQAFTAESYSD